MGPFEETKQDTQPGNTSPPAGPPTAPVLILAHSTDGLRRPELFLLPKQGITLGRGTAIFGGDPLLDRRLSREHASLMPTPGGWRLCDLQSRNGSWIEGTRLLGAAPLPPDTVFRLGDTLFLFTHCTLQASEESIIVGISQQIQALRAAIQVVAPSMTSVLITGETGTGKEMVAQELHTRSNRKGRLVSLNCAAIPEGLLASELFGHVKGAFTGASDARDGLFRAADGGTLFLDEIGEMPLALQVQLLRVLETKTVRPVGSTRDLPVDVRIVAATNRDLPAAIRASTFRSDLYVRLAQWQVKLPPLRERRADIPFLIQSLQGRLGQGERGMTLELASALLQHSWPFNVRGLLNILMAAGIGSPPAQPLALGPEVLQSLEIERTFHNDRVPPRQKPVSSRASPPREFLEQTLRSSAGRVAEAARRLGCSRQQVYRWMEDHQIDPGAFK